MCPVYSREGLVARCVRATRPAGPGAMKQSACQGRHVHLPLVFKYMAIGNDTYVITNLFCLEYNQCNEKIIISLVIRSVFKDSILRTVLLNDHTDTHQAYTYTYMYSSRHCHFIEKTYATYLPTKMVEAYITFKLNFSFCLCDMHH